MSLAAVFGHPPAVQYFEMASRPAAPPRHAEPPAVPLIYGEPHERMAIRSVLEALPTEVGLFAARHMVFACLRSWNRAEVIDTRGRRWVAVLKDDADEISIAHEIAHAVSDHYATADPEIYAHQEYVATRLAASWGFSR